MAQFDGLPEKKNKIENNSLTLDALRLMSIKDRTKVYDQLKVLEFLGVPRATSISEVPLVLSQKIGGQPMVVVLEDLMSAGVFKFKHYLRLEDVIKHIEQLDTVGAVSTMEQSKKLDTDTELLNKFFKQSTNQDKEYLYTILIEVKRLSGFSENSFPSALVEYLDYLTYELKALHKEEESIKSVIESLHQDRPNDFYLTVESFARVSGYNIETIKFKELMYFIHAHLRDKILLAPKYFTLGQIINFLNTDPGVEEIRKRKKI